MKGKLLRLLILVINLVMISTFASVVNAEQVPRMTKEELKPLLDDAAVVTLDVRASRHWKGSERKIRGAIRENPKRFESWAHKYSKDKIIVLYCA